MNIDYTSINSSHTFNNLCDKCQLTVSLHLTIF